MLVWCDAVKIYGSRLICDIKSRTMPYLVIKYRGNVLEEPSPSFKELASFKMKIKSPIKVYKVFVGLPDRTFKIYVI